MAERLLAEKDTEKTRNILAECYMAENKHYKVYHILKDCKSDQNRYYILYYYTYLITFRYKFALACLKLNKLRDAERTLTSE